MTIIQFISRYANYIVSLDIADYIILGKQDIFFTHAKRVRIRSYGRFITRYANYVTLPFTLHILSALDLKYKKNFAEKLL